MVFLVWCLIVGTVDNVLKPILFGRGARVPTLVIFVGAIGGMIAMGIIGLDILLKVGPFIQDNWRFILISVLANGLLLASVFRLFTPLREP